MFKHKSTIFILLILFSMSCALITPKQEGYHPPMECFATMKYIGGGEVVLHVTGLNSTVFCRRVISTFSEDYYFKVIETNKQDFDKNKFQKICHINGDDNFEFDVYSNSDIGNYFCYSLNMGEIL